VRPRLDLVSAGVRNQPDVSQPPVVGFRCGKVENLGRRMKRMKKGGPHVLYDLNDLLFSLHIYRVPVRETGARKWSRFMASVSGTSVGL